MASNDQAKSEEILTPLERWPTVRRWAKYTSAIIAGVGVAAAGIGYLTSGVDFFSQPPATSAIGPGCIRSSFLPMSA